METINERQTMTIPKDVLQGTSAAEAVTMQRLADFKKTADYIELQNQFGAHVLDEVTFEGRKNELFERYLKAHPVLVPA